MSTIQISHLSKSYGKFPAVADLSLEVPCRQRLRPARTERRRQDDRFQMHVWACRAPTGGDVLYDGNVRLRPRRSTEIAYVPERSVLYEWMSVAEHVEMNRRAFAGFEPARAIELLGQFNVEPRKRVRTLSKGMRTAVMVALAFARNARILVLDEPTSGLDPVNQRHVLSLIINEAARGNSVIFSSHQIGQVERAAERIAVIDRGRLVLEGLVDDLKADRKIVEGIVPDATSSLDGITGDPRIARVDRTERIVRLLVLAGADDIATRLTHLGASGVRVLDLNLEDIFLYAVSPADATAGVVSRE